MAKLIAAVATAVLVGGVRTVIQPGEELPEINDHDSAELVNAGMAKDPRQEAAKARAQAKEKAAAEAEMDAARTAVQQAQASTTDGAAPAAPKK